MIYLASQSPRRRELLRSIGITHEVITLRQASGRRVDVDESVLPNEPADVYVRRVARAKAHAGAQAVAARRLPLHPVLGADTTVSLGSRILGKPAHREEAIAMLTRLSGSTHEVFTAVCVIDRHGDAHEALSRTEVRFEALTPERIARYVDSGEPFDKAGAYGIQGRAAAFVQHLAGSYSGVVGLPLHETAVLLRAAGLEVPAS